MSRPFRRRLTVLAVLIAVVALIGFYRRRELERSASEFHARYG